MDLEDLAICAGFLAATGLLVWGAFALADYKCGSQAKMMGLDHNFSVAAGCMVKTEKGKWVPLSSFRTVEGD